MAKRKRKPTKARATKPEAKSPKRKRKPSPVAAPRGKAKAAVSPAKPTPSARRLSKTPEAIAARERRAVRRREAERIERELERKREHRNELARRRYADRKAIDEAKEAERLEKLAEAAEKRRQKKKPGPPDERKLAVGWLERIRNKIAEYFAVSLEITEAEPGATTPWLLVGRFDVQEGGVGYQQIAEAFEGVANDVILEAMIHPQRLSQIRIIYSDPDAKRGESDSIVSKIGSWEFVLGDLIGELVGSGADDEDALAVRYAATRVGTFYVYFSSEILGYVTAAPWAKTQTVKLK